MNKIKSLLVYSIVLITIILVKINSLSAQSVDFKIESWEKRINDRQPPEIVMEEAGFESGMTVGEVGAGTGRMTLWIADKIGPEGIIYANDIDEQGLKHLYDPVALLRNTRSAFKPGGYLVIVDCDPDKVAWGKGHGCTGKEVMRDKLKLAGYELVEISDVLREDGIYIARPGR